MHKIDYDTHWKEIITHLFEDFIAFFLPGAFPLIDFNKRVEFLEQELHKIVADNTKKGKTVNDKLVKVFLKNGEEKWILIHIEVQSTFETIFSERMFVYFYRIFDKYSKKITALAIHTSEQVPKQSGKYKYDFLQTKLTYEYNTYLVKNATEEKLLKSNNPFALAILATKYLHQSKEDVDKRFHFKMKLVRLAKEKKFSNKYIINLLKFIDFILYLPEDLEKQFAQETIQEFIKPKDMQTSHSREFSNQLHLALYGETMDEFIAKTEKKLKIYKSKLKENESQIKEADSKLKEKDSKLKEKDSQIKEAIEGLLVKKMNISEIARIMNVTVEKVEEVKREMKSE